MRTVILENIDTPFAEVVQNSAIGYVVPHSVYPAGYHCDPSQPLPFAGIAAQKHHIGLDMGKSGVRVKTLDDVPLDVVGKLFKRVKAKKFIALYEAAVPPSARKTAKTENPTATKKTAAKKRVAKRT